MHTAFVTATDRRVRSSVKIMSNVEAINSHKRMRNSNNIDDG
jgi:hypothetical protein